MTKEQFEKAQELHKEHNQLTSAKRLISQCGILRESGIISDLLSNKKWIDSDKRISEMVIKEMDVRLAEIEKEIELL